MTLIRSLWFNKKHVSIFNESHLMICLAFLDHVIMFMNLSIWHLIMIYIKVMLKMLNPLVVALF